MNNLRKIDEAIKKSWMKIRKDYNKGFLLQEDSLKSSFYYHLRGYLGDKYLERNNYRMYTELHIKRLKADLAIVKLSQNNNEEILSDRITNLLAIVEFKFQNERTGIIRMGKDIRKLMNYGKMAKVSRKTKYYFAFIHENKDKIDEVRKLARNNNKICILTVNFSNNKDFNVKKCICE